MLIYLDETTGKAMLDLLNTEAAFGTLAKCLYKTINDIEDGLKDHENRR